ncbi:hypothetical protein V6N12_064024 [Hibiscus sabdariffa]|uniref:Uncharacterized protein n=1 Tax=Hibiscus sabdariffa TaxID=183260 RepID=A0ABR2ATZ4_9ROSI
MACLEETWKEEQEECTQDGSIDWHGHPAIKTKSGQWTAGIIILLNQGLATLAFFGVGVNLVLFLTRVLGQNNADAANNVSKWTGTVYIFSLVGAFLSDAYWGRYKTCAIFQVIFVIGLVSLSLSSYLFLIRPKGCGNQEMPCGSHSGLEITLFYLSIYLIALGNGGYQPNIATFGADQFDEEDPKEGHSKVAFFSYFYLALNLGSLFSNTILGYFEDEGMWALGFWVSAGSALAGLVLFLAGTTSYRHFKPSGNPLSRFSQVLVAAIRKCSVDMPPDADELYDVDGNDSSMNGNRKILHTDEFKFLDRAAYISTRDVDEQKKGIHSTWRLCPVTQVEEVKCILRLLPIWLCTIIYSVLFTQMASLFVEQGAAMKTTVSNFRIPPASMSSFDILSVALFIFLYRRVLDPLVASIRKKGARGLTELQRMGIGLVIAVLAMVSAGIVECYRLKNRESEEMKLSFKLQEEKNPVLKASIPISIFSQPFVSSLTTTTPTSTTTDNKSSQNTSFSLCTNFPSGPCLKLSYAPSTSPSNTIPFSLSLKSGLGLFGSPKDSPLVFSAHFSLSSVNPGTIIPAFSLHLKPQFGNFSFYKSTSSKPSLESDSGSHHSVSEQPASPSNSVFGNPDSASVWQDVKLEPRSGAGDGLHTPKFGYGTGLYSNDGFGMERSLVRKDNRKAGILGGIAVRARTTFPVTKKAVVNLRWIVNLSSDVGSKMPYLTINKIGVEKLDEVKEMKEEKNKSNEDEFELHKGVYSRMRRDLEVLGDENREMKQCIEDMRHGVSARKATRENEGLGRRASTPSAKNSNHFEQWRSKKSSAEDNGGREAKKNATKMSELESELQKAIKAAPT